MAGEVSAETKPKVEGGGETISIKVKDQSGGEVVFRVKPSTKFERIFKAFADKKAQDANTVKFLYDGERVHGHQTPEELGMENDDCVDAVIEQVGGGR